MKDIIIEIGEEALLEQIAEESAELAQASLKLARKMRGENPTPKTQDECVARVLEEIADVYLTIDEWLKGKPPGFIQQINSTMEYKLERWEGRIRDQKNRQKPV